MTCGASAHRSASRATSPKSRRKPTNGSKSKRHCRAVTGSCGCSPWPQSVVALHFEEYTMNLLSKIQSLSHTKPIPASFVYNGERIDFFVKVLTAGEVESIGERNLGKKKGESVNFRSRVISMAVVDENGKTVIPLNQAIMLPNDLSLKLWEPVAEVNGFKGEEDDEDGVSEEGKSSPETTDSD